MKNICKKLTNKIDFVKILTLLIFLYFVLYHFILCIGIFQIPAHHFDIKSLFKRSKKELGPKWQVLKHNGPIFSSPYRSLPQKVHFKYKGIFSTTGYSL